MFQVLELAVPISSLVCDTIFFTKLYSPCINVYNKDDSTPGASKVDRSGSSANLSGTGKKYINRISKLLFTNHVVIVVYWYVES